MIHRASPPALSLALAALVALAACSTAGKGASAGESASASPPASPTPRLEQPDSLPKSEPSRQQEYPVVLAPAGTDTATGPRATIARLEREARAIAKSDGCHSVAACKAAPVGARACGGPRTYIVYCAATTDTLALQRKLRELERVEKAYNETSGMMSTCEMRLAPVTELVGTTCRAAGGAGAARGAPTTRVP